MAIGAKKARVNRLTAARTAPSSFRFRATRNRRRAWAFSRRLAGLCRPCHGVPDGAHVSRISVHLPRCGPLAVSVPTKEGFDEGSREASARDGNLARDRSVLAAVARRGEEGGATRSGSWARSTTARPAMVVSGYEISLTLRADHDQREGGRATGATRSARCRPGTTTRSRSRPRTTAPFVSYNSGIAPPTPPPASQASDVYNSSSSQTFNFDAYVFPDGLPVTPLTVSILKSDTAAAPAEGSIRLRPTTQSVIQDQAAGVTGQVWANDQDMLANVVSDVFAGGSVVIDATRLVYGVTYQVTVYGVDGYQPQHGDRARRVCRRASSSTSRRPLRRCCWSRARRRSASPTASRRTCRRPRRSCSRSTRRRSRTRPRRWARARRSSTTA